MKVETMETQGRPVGEMVVDMRLDITGDVCPITFVRTKLMIEGMKPGMVAEVRLNEGEPLHNVPRSIREHGHRILSLEPEDVAAGVWRLVLRKE